VGVEDRDWFREGSAERLGVTTSAAITPSVGFRHGAWLAIVVSLVVTALVWRRDLLHLRMPAGETARATSAEDRRIVRLRPSPGLDVAVAEPRRWSVSGAWGTVSVVVPVGKTPREALTVELAERGWQVTAPVP
jgi:hypothetical protein